LLLWVLIAFAAGAGLEGLVFHVPKPLGPVVIIGSATGCLGCIVRSLTQLRSTLPYAKFKGEVLTCVAFAALPSMCGTYLGDQPIGNWPFVAATWALIFVFIFPKILRFKGE
jgi:hypothetical protein